MSKGIRIMVLPRRERRQIKDEPRQRQHPLPWVYFAMLLLFVLALVAVVVIVTLCVDPVQLPRPS